MKRNGSAIKKRYQMNHILMAVVSFQCVLFEVLAIYKPSCSFSINLNLIWVSVKKAHAQFELNVIESLKCKNLELIEKKGAHNPPT